MQDMLAGGHLMKTARLSRRSTTSAKTSHSASLLIVGKWCGCAVVRSHNCYFNDVDNAAPAPAADPSRRARADTRSRSPVLIPVRRSAPSSSSTDNVADLVAEVRAGVQLWRRQAAAMRATADRLKEVVMKIDRDRVA